VSAEAQSSFAVATLRAPPSIDPTSSIMAAPESSMAAPTAAPKRVGRSRRIVTSRFKGFDADDDDITSVPEYSQAQPVPTPVSQSQESGMFVSQEMDADEQIIQEIASQTRRSQKRRTPPPIDEEDEDDFFDQLAPEAANLKRRRIEEDIARRRRGESTPPLVLSVSKSVLAAEKPKKKPKEPIDVLEVARIQREKEEEAARADREALQQAMGDMDIDSVRHLAPIQVMDVRRSAPPPRNTGHADDGERWDERWNGRKNFKKFRRRGDVGVRAANKVIVPLEAVKRKDFGIGDEYWLEAEKDTHTRKDQGKERARATPTVSQVETQARRHSARNEPEDVVVDSHVEIFDDPPPPSKIIAISQRASVGRSQDQSQNSANKAKGKAGASQLKRPAEPMVKPVPAKKPKQTTRRAVEVDSDDSDDGLGFKFKKK
jgi:nijmegen breakage syndrome protein 1